MQQNVKGTIMPEVQAINQLATTLQNSILATMAIVTLAVIFMMIWQIRSNNAQDKRQAETINTVLHMQTRALDNKEQLGRLADGQDTAVVVMQNMQHGLLPFPEWIRDINLAIQTFHEMVDSLREMIKEQGSQIQSLRDERTHEIKDIGEKVDTLMDNNVRLVILLERLNANLERFNTNMERFNADIAEIKRMVAKQITSEQPAVKPETDAPQVDAPKDE
jgi:methyl-accepting chemotaxis protein